MGDKQSAPEEVTGYQVVLYVGDTKPDEDGHKVVDLTPVELSVESVLEALRQSGVTPADLRSRTVVRVDGDQRKAVAVYAALLGFAGRRLDVTDGDQVVPIAAIEDRVSRLPDAGRPPEPVAQIQVGPVVRADLVCVTPDTGLGPDVVSTIRYAKRVRFVPATGTPRAVAAVSQLAVIAAIRARGGNDRLPYLVEGDEPVAPDDDPTQVVGLCLDTLRRGGVELRRSLRFDDRGALAPRALPTPRQRTLLAAEAVPIEHALVALGATQDPVSGLWHCPRPDRHTNGDANASMKVQKGKTQCFRCDAERVDSLRLAMDVKGFIPDEAADWLLAHVG